MNRTVEILKHILEDCHDIGQFVAGVTEESFVADKMRMKAVSMSLVNIGELVKVLPPSFCEEYQHIPWKRISGMRDVVAHKYRTLSMSAVWEVAIHRIPELQDFLEEYLRSH